MSLIFTITDLYPKCFKGVKAISKCIPSTSISELTKISLLEFIIAASSPGPRRVLSLNNLIFFVSLSISPNSPKSFRSIFFSSSFMGANLVQ